MRTDRWLLAALAFLVGGLWLTFAWCHGNAGLAFALPLSGTRLTLDITSTGWPVLIGVPLAVIGVVVMIIAFIAAVVAQFHRPDEVERDSVTRLNLPSQ